HRGCSAWRTRDSRWRNHNLESAAAALPPLIRTHISPLDRGYRGRRPAPRFPSSFGYPRCFRYGSGVMRLPGLHDPLLLLYFALIVDAVFGEMGPLFRVLPHPVVVAGRAIAGFERRLNRPRRSERARLARGVATAVVLVGLAAAFGWGLQWLCRL